MAKASARPSALRRPLHWAGWCLGAVLALLLSVALGIAIGETALSPSLVLQVLANKLAGASYAIDPISQGIVWNY
ncbi:MAG: hypothetical protein LBE58_13545, partial [Comamonas sp.]|nr:hypothetical protein [Comamonas sp.]